MTHPHNEAPTSRRRHTLWGMAALGALVVLLLILASSVPQVEMEPGETLFEPGTTADVEYGAGSSSNEAPPILTAVFRWTIVVLMGLACAVVAYVTIGALFNKLHRAFFLFLLIIFLGIFGFYQWASNREDPGQEVRQQTMEAEELPIVSETAPYQRPQTPAPSTSTMLLVAIGIAGALTGIGLWVWFKVILPRRREQALESMSELAEVAETLGQVAAKIRLGADARASVLEAYAEMVRILSIRQPMIHKHLTPREFATALRKTGMTTQHVDELTRIFEFVRYGRRDDPHLANRAIDCLESIRTAYGSTA